MATVSQWVQGARPRTLPAAVAPVAAGTGAAAALDGAHAGRALLALVVSLALQVGVNYANDYSDGVRGTDDDRVGPLRLTGSGLARPSHVRAAAFLALGLGALAGLVLVVVSAQWVLLPVGALSVLAAWFYTGGSRPYGYLGLGEVFVFVFFGLVAVLGTTLTQAGRLSWTALACACAIGSLACAILVANNLRDVPTDTVAGKRTLAVRLGEARTRVLFAALVGAAFALVTLVGVLADVGALLGLLPGVLAARVVRRVLTGARGLDLVPVLAGTGVVELGVGVLLLVGLAV